MGTVIRWSEDKPVEVSPVEETAGIRLAKTGHAVTGGISEWNTADDRPDEERNDEFGKRFRKLNPLNAKDGVVRSALCRASKTSGARLGLHKPTSEACHEITQHEVEVDPDGTLDVATLHFCCL